MGKSFLKLKAGSLAVALVAMTAMSGCKKGSSQNVAIDGVDGPYVAIVGGKLTMTTVLKNVTFDGGIRLPIPHAPNSYVEVGPDFQSAGTLIAVGLDVADLEFLGENTQLLQPNTLPGGRPLPGIIGGQLPSLAVQVPSLNDTVFYVGLKALGIFVPVKLNAAGAIATFRFYDAEESPIGTLSIVGEDTNGKNSGFLLMINLDGKVGSLMKRM